MRAISGFKLWLGAALILAVGACSPVFRNHGYIPTDDDLEQIVVGVDTRATVDDLVGAPSAGGLLKGGDYYYVRSRVKHIGLVRPKVIDRQVLAISFDGDTVQNIERFGLEDGQIVPLARRVTNSSVDGKGFLRQLLGNIGAINPGALLGN